MFNTLTVRTWDLMIPRPSWVLVTNPDRQLPCHFSKTVLRIPSKACLSFLESVGDEKAQGQVNCPCANAFAQQKHFTAQKRRASTRRSASRLDSNYLTAEANSAYNYSPLRCELMRDFARGTRGTLKCSGEVNSPCANAFAQQKHFTAQKRRRGRSG